jgi:hypothetical protein
MIRLVTAAAALIVCGTPLVAQPARNGSQLVPSLVPSDSAWQMGGPANSDLMVALVDGRPTFRVGKTGLVLSSRDRLTGDVEFRLRFRMTSPDDKGCVLSCAPGLAAIDKLNANSLRLGLQLLAGPDPDYLIWSLAPLPDSKVGSGGRYGVSPLPKNRLTWPDLARRRLETDVASEPRITDRWLTLRYQLRAHEARVYLDDRLLRAVHHPKIDTEGFVQWAFGRGVEIASLSVVPLRSADHRFETVALGAYVNADKFRGGTIALEPRGQAVVGGVPFLIPEPDDKKRDHVDLKPSWLPVGGVAGDFYANQPEVGRWLGALERQRGRIQFRVPNAGYTRLHLLAASSGEPDTTPTVTAQFYRPQAGAPINFTGDVPVYSTASTHILATTMTGGAKVNLHLVTIPLEPDGVAAFADLDHLEFELTKAVRRYRAFPDPIQYSEHGGGLPSGVHIYGITLERPAVEVDFQPDAFANVWTAPVQPSYTAKLTNVTAAAQPVELELTTTSHDGKAITKVRSSAKLDPNATVNVTLPLELPAKYGHHDVELKVVDPAGGPPHTVRRTLAYLHPDTRERGNWKEGKGPIFGLWDWNGGHGTPKGLDRLRVMATAGMESAMTSFVAYPPEEKAFLESIGAQSFFLGYQLAMNKVNLGGKEWDPMKPAEMQAALIEHMRKSPLVQASKVNRPELVVFFAEPLVGPISYISQPEHFGEPPYEMTDAEKANYQRYLDQFVIAGQAIRKEWPDAKLLFPWGIPSFPIPFLRYSKEARDLMDGPALDLPVFERLPEMQLHQVTFSSTIWQLKQDWLKAGKTWPTFSTIEGPAISPAHSAALTPRQEADHSIRSYLILAAYGTTRHLGWPVGFHCQGYWGETHYGAGLISPLPLLNPRPVFSAYATLTRQLNRMNFTKLVPTGSNTTFCCQFKHYKTGELLHVFWTLKGTRPVTIENAAADFSVADGDDNAATCKHGAAFIVSSSPCYVRGLTTDAKINLGVPNHSDSKPAAESTVVANLGDPQWKLSTERDPHYEESHAEFVRRFPGNFTLAREKRAKDDPFGPVALVVHLDKQEKERRTMPFYTTLAPAKPIVLPGRPSHLGLWVKASSDWGRVVYCLKDAKGERWISVGMKGEWNVDDTHCWSQFCFDGTRYLRFELPGSLPYDGYREAGTSFWGHYGPGDGVVDYPLTLEKILVERRTHVIAPTEQVPASPDDVLLGRLYAEYEHPADKTADAVRQARLRMPLPPVPPDLSNPLKKLAETGTGLGPAIKSVAPPERDYDGSRCHVHFEPQESATKYDLWVSPYADGRGAVLLGKGWAKPGQVLNGLSPNIDLYLFVVAIDVGGKHTRPGPAFKIHLKDMFPMR